MKTAELYTQLERATGKMQEALTFPNDEPHKESTIQRFEYTFELSWKLMSSIINDQGIESYGVRNVLREGYKLQLIDNVEVWFKYADARNQTAHIYRQSVADEVVAIAQGGFVDDVKKLLETTSTYDSRSKK
ncbi:nucleotidyltransferase [Candidatus Roizmanbacteria bacterium CG_4_9_14_0_2_um_filter_39_13]|uniref:Nucleotidyltransferase n=2 Tax=Candidatus Roizmaniibacteriota TaxID=1752723 RepID=A0A2M8EW43_9BACT|nr:MAG: nucleotidyltransferase [Candidatus Roizmanbacteria bacterium CG_4_10_14_0_2_um_filter_39_12]PJC30083.1 MAG: nucleotidyltransferase [Candidatus Roizmanbacteria bacterium CG_4_9_14_0_2_um_filter_39_13]PJE61388.1 MAG: nucleotidyltransferase [Candidatus Roizmanbacteria bacterium CG10_big_fil_rev_8_21_14_0_10_39_12]